MIFKLAIKTLLSLKMPEIFSTKNYFQTCAEAFAANASEQAARANIVERRILTLSELKTTLDNDVRRTTNLNTSCYRIFIVAKQSQHDRPPSPPPPPPPPPCCKPPITLPQKSLEFYTYKSIIAQSQFPLHKGYRISRIRCLCTVFSPGKPY